MKKYRCTRCGYLYDPGLGDSSQNIPAGTPFEQLPDSWRCPRCGVKKDRFVESEG
ncbi:MAG: rubredoxin [Methanoculleaceae archaeon]